METQGLCPIKMTWIHISTYIYLPHRNKVCHHSLFWSESLCSEQADCVAGAICYLTEADSTVLHCCCVIRSHDAEPETIRQILIQVIHPNLKQNLPLVCVGPNHVAQHPTWTQLLDWSWFYFLWLFFLFIFNWLQMPDMYQGCWFSWQIVLFTPGAQ